MKLIVACLVAAATAQLNNLAPLMMMGGLGGRSSYYSPYGRSYGRSRSSNGFDDLLPMMALSGGLGGTGLGGTTSNSLLPMMALSGGFGGGRGSSNNLLPMMALSGGFGGTTTGASNDLLPMMALSGGFGGRGRGSSNNLLPMMALSGGFGGTTTGGMTDSLLPLMMMGGFGNSGSYYNYPSRSNYGYSAYAPARGRGYAQAPVRNVAPALYNPAPVRTAAPAAPVRNVAPAATAPVRTAAAAPVRSIGNAYAGIRAPMRTQAAPMRTQAWSGAAPMRTTGGFRGGIPAGNFRGGIPARAPMVGPGGVQPTEDAAPAQDATPMLGGR